VFNGEFGDPQPRVRSNPEILATRLDEESVLLNPADGNYYALDVVGSRAWELCDGSRTLSEIAEIVGVEFEADPAMVSADLAELFADMADAGLVQTAD
jgi:coenzyme PQQ synthesis protein D (PqqD)